MNNTATIDSFNPRSVLNLWREVTAIGVGVIAQHGLESTLSEPIDVALESTEVELAKQSDKSLFRDITSRALQTIQQDVIQTIEQASAGLEEAIIDEWTRATGDKGQPTNA